MHTHNVMNIINFPCKVDNRGLDNRGSTVSAYITIMAPPSYISYLPCYANMSVATILHPAGVREAQLQDARARRTAGGGMLVPGLLEDTAAVNTTVILHA